MSKQSRHILLAEDNPDHAELAMRALKRSGQDLQVHHAKDGEDAWNYLFRKGDSSYQNRPPVDVMLLDLRMPRIDGLELLSRIKEDEELRTIPVVVLTSSDSDSDIEQAYKLHANSYLVKPFHYPQLHAMLMAVEDYWLIRNRNIAKS